MAQEAFHFLKKKNPSSKLGYATKLEMNKAYDWVDWYFLREVLIFYGFNSVWVSRVMSLVSTVKYCYQVNGSRIRVISLGSGLRQEDP